MLREEALSAQRLVAADAQSIARGHQIDGWVHSRLGILYRPKYFYDGVAIHGNPNVPPDPASHGCVRMINAAIDWLWANDELPIGTAVWAY